MSYCSCAKNQDIIRNRVKVALGEAEAPKSRTMARIDFQLSQDAECYRYC